MTLPLVRTLASMSRTYVSGPVYSVTSLIRRCTWVGSGVGVAVGVGSGVGVRFRVRVKVTARVRIWV